jgi:hypothetical protein
MRVTSFIIGLIPVLISLLISIIFYKRLKPSWLRLFTWFLLFSMLISITGYFYSFYLKRGNHFILNIYLLVQFLFYFGIFYKTFQTKKLKTFTLFVSICLSVLFSSTNFIRSIPWPLRLEVCSLYYFACCILERCLMPMDL